MNRHWFYRDSRKQQVGPIEEDSFLKLVDDGVIHDSTEVWRSGVRDWMPYADLKKHDAIATTHSASVSAVVSSGGTNESAASLSLATHGVVAMPVLTQESSPATVKCDQCSVDVAHTAVCHHAGRQL